LRLATGLHLQLLGKVDGRAFYDRAEQSRLVAELLDDGGLRTAGVMTSFNEVSA
jgi:hypothetical protein